MLKMRLKKKHDLKKQIIIERPMSENKLHYMLVRIENIEIR